jgi:hypothetical protein
MAEKVLPGLTAQFAGQELALFNDVLVFSPTLEPMIACTSLGNPTGMVPILEIFR